MEEYTICADCKHANFVDKRVWQRFCKASPRPETINFVTGESGFAGVNDLGGRYVTTEKFFCCHTINTDGHCEKFERKFEKQPASQRWRLLTMITKKSTITSR